MWAPEVETSCGQGSRPQRPLGPGRAPNWLWGRGASGASPGPQGPILREGLLGQFLGTPRPGGLYPHPSCGHLALFPEPVSAGGGGQGTGEVCSCEVSLPVTPPDRGQSPPGLDIPKNCPSSPSPFYKDTVTLD